MAAAANDSLSPTLHASAVAIDGQGVLIVGASGSGKSSLALTLMAFGAELIGDDRIHVQAQKGRLIASAAQTIAGKIEARGVGILAARHIGPTAITLCVDLDQVETERLPRVHQFAAEGLQTPLLLGKGNPYLAPAILQLIKSGRISYES